MDTAGFIAMAAGGALVLAAGAVALVRGRRSRPAPCGGCGRAMRAGRARCPSCGVAAPERNACLEFIGGPLAGQVVGLDGPLTTLGSVAGNTVVLSDPAVSREHVAIRQVGKRYEIADLGSTNGVYVNGHRVPRRVLGSGDRVRVGNTELVFHER